MEEELYSRRKSNLTFLFLVALSLFFITANLGEYVQVVKRLTFYVLMPSPANSSSIINSSSKLAENIKAIVTAHQENIRLKNEIQKFARLEDDWLKTKEENRRLNNLLGFTEPKGTTSVIAKVVSRQPGRWFQWVIINKGRKSGLSIDLPVLSWSNNKFCVLGRIGEVFDNYSKVVLITNALSSFPVMVGQNNEDGLLEGQNDYLLRLNYLIPSDDIKLGDDVVTSPLSSVLPSKILVGKIVDFTESDDERFRSVIVGPAADMSSIREVVVIVNDKK